MISRSGGWLQAQVIIWDKRGAPAFHMPHIGGDAEVAFDSDAALMFRGWSASHCVSGEIGSSQEEKLAQLIVDGSH